MTARQIAQALAQERCDLDTLNGEANKAKLAGDADMHEIWMCRIADLCAHIRNEAFRLSQKDWMPQPHKTYWAALRMLDVER